MIPFKKRAINQAISDVINSQRKQIITPRGWAGFADAKPSESIQKHELPGLSVAVLFPFKPGFELLDIPVKQFKDSKSINQKISNAERLTNWLYTQKDMGLNIEGFCLTQTQITAAKYGLKLIEELPGIQVETHFDKFRLYFSNSHIDFAQAVALEYYLFAAYFGMLRPSLKIRNLRMSLILYMDRFPGTSTGELQYGQPAPKTDGMKFIEYVREHSETYRGIDEDHKANKIELLFKTLEWWSPLGEAQPRRGKTHPHFLLPDWLVAASIANEYRGEFIASYSQHRKAIQLADKCEELYKAFKSFNIWSMDDKSFNYIIGSKKQSEIPQVAKDFILNRAER